ncbi:dienelactone hydrolase [Saccharibacillus sp. O16]|nr:dienelactone hydrolase [Saccharibacillus sp. O16]
MRNLELLLLISNISWLAVMILSKKELRRRGALAISGAAILFLMLHLILEGYRIQLLPLYGMTIGTLPLSLMLHGSLRQAPRSKRRRFFIRSAYGTAILLLVAAIGLSYIFPIFKLPQPSGRFQVGTQTLHFVDNKRAETLGASPSGKRELMIQVWYPAQKVSGHPAPLIPDTRILPHMAANYGLPGFTFEYLRYVSSHSYAQAPVSSEKPSYPLILGNPGFGSSRFLHTSQAEDLASHGYIVAVIDHTYNTFATEFPDGRVTTDATSGLFSPDHSYAQENASRDQLGQLLTDDVEFVLDRFSQLQSGEISSPFQGKLDMEHIGIFGHSIGGAAAYDAMYDPRIDAGIDLDGGLYGLDERQQLHKPVLFIHSASEAARLQRIMEDRPYTDAELKQMNSTREWEDQVAADKQRELQRIRQATLQGGQSIYLTDSEHLNFTDVSFISPVFKFLGVTGYISPNRAAAVIDTYMLDFFNAHLNNQGSGALKQGTDSRFPEVKLLFDAPDSP